MRRRLVSTAAAAGVLVGALALSGCSGAAKAGTAPPTGQATDGAAAVLAQVRQDLAGVDGASAQADADISAAEAAQAQNDNP